MKIKEFLVKYKSGIEYVVFALLTSLLHIGTFALADYLLESLILCNVIAYAVSILAAFFINKTVVFEKKEGSVVWELIKFLLVKFSSFLIDTVILMLLTHWWLAMPSFWAKLIANCSTTLNNYWLMKLFVFKKEE